MLYVPGSDRERGPRGPRFVHEHVRPAAEARDVALHHNREVPPAVGLPLPRRIKRKQPEPEEWTRFLRNEIVREIPQVSDMEELGGNMASMDIDFIKAIFLPECLCCSLVALGWLS